MGCCVMAAMNQTIEQQKQIASQQSANPYITATGEVVVPMNSYTGEFAKPFPQWLQDAISNENWAQVITHLNSVSMPLMDQLISQQKELVNDMFKPSLNPMGGMNQHMERSGKEQALTQQLIRDIESKLYEINTKILNPCGLVAQSTLNALGMQQQGGLNSGHMMQQKPPGIKVTRMQKQVVQVVQQPVMVVQQQQPQQGEGGGEDLPSYDQATKQ